jgi:hypothetical protein
MTKRKRKLTAAEKEAKRRRRTEFMTVFIGGKQKRVRRPVTIDGMDVEEFIRLNADPLWLHQNEMWEDIRTDCCIIETEPTTTAQQPRRSDEDDEIPF